MLGWPPPTQGWPPPTQGNFGFPSAGHVVISNLPGNATTAGGTGANDGDATRAKSVGLNTLPAELSSILQAFDTNQDGVLHEADVRFLAENIKRQQKGKLSIAGSRVRAMSDFTFLTV